ncbi:26237_t:CDS:2 [Racocetra persica]|uniref:26237_t:CDS:1 n=1 Tax=Racocetra persica TaxID=160502 RepID=A0ACA9SDG4_9GLOM|nr:26237_t:CDS:2 [Racocetra persica]
MEITSKDICEQILKLANEGITPSQISIYLRNLYNFRPFKNITSNKVVRILKLNGLAPKILEDLYHLITKLIIVCKYLKYNRSDKVSKFWLILIESKIHHLARFYKTERQLPSD